jgi:DNA-binding NtrC family response regulator
MWAALAADVGLTFHTSDSLATLDPRAPHVGLIAAGGAEDALPDALRQASSREIAVAAVGALPCHRTAVAALRAGAADYFALPDDLDRLRSWLVEHAERLRQRAQRSAFADVEAGKYRFDGILGESPALMKALGLASRVIPHANVTVLVTGETGTGKELLARAVHYNGPRRGGAFV